MASIIASAKGSAGQIAKKRCLCGLVDIAYEFYTWAKQWCYLAAEIDRIHTSAFDRRSSLQREISLAAVIDTCEERSLVAQADELFGKTERGQQEWWAEIRL